MKAARLTQADFYKLCEELKNQREKILAGLNVIDLAKIMTEKFGKKVSAWSVNEALAATGIELPKKKHGDAKGSGKVLVKAVVTLYRRLGESVPQDLAELYERFVGREVPQAIPVPVKSVQDSRSIPVVNGPVK